MWIGRVRGTPGDDGEDVLGGGDDGGGDRPKR